MLCRVADSLFWMGRYMERAENTARLVDVYLQIVLELQNNNMEKHWEPILKTTGDYELFLKLYDEVDHYTVPEFLTFNLENPSSIYSCIVSIRENARQIRDQISTEMWEVINRLYLELKSVDIRKVWSQEPYLFYRTIKENSHLFHGLTSATFPQREGVSFIDAGKHLERAEKTARILDLKYHLSCILEQDTGGTIDIAQWSAILKACSALEAYHQNYTTGINAEDVSDFLILSEYFPRSIRFCIDKLDQNIHAISGCPRTHYSNEVERICGKYLSDLKFTNKQKITNYGMHEYLQHACKMVDTISLELNKAYMFFPIVDPVAELVAKR